MYKITHFPKSQSLLNGKKNMNESRSKLLIKILMFNVHHPSLILLVFALPLLFQSGTVSIASQRGNSSTEMHKVQYFPLAFLEVFLIQPNLHFIFKHIQAVCFHGLSVTPLPWNGDLPSPCAPFYRNTTVELGTDVPAVLEQPHCRRASPAPAVGKRTANTLPSPDQSLLYLLLWRSALSTVQNLCYGPQHFTGIIKIVIL